MALILNPHLTTSYAANIYSVSPATHRNTNTKVCWVIQPSMWFFASIKTFLFHRRTGKAKFMQRKAVLENLRASSCAFTGVHLLYFYSVNFMEYDPFIFSWCVSVYSPCESQSSLRAKKDLHKVRTLKRS